jgi:hypothetical protein
MQAAFLRYQPVYETELVSVERPAKAKERYGPQVITSVRDSNRTKYAFADSLVKVVIYPAKDRVAFDLSNQTQHSIKIPWNDAAFVGVDGKSESVMHTGVKYNECSSPKAPSVVVQRGSMDDELIPCSHVSFGYSSWIISNLIPTAPVTASDTARIMGAAQQYVGKTISVLLPLQIEDVVNDYLFTFQIKSARLAPASAY